MNGCSTHNIDRRHTFVERVMSSSPPNTASSSTRERWAQASNRYRDKRLAEKKRLREEELGKELAKK
jgi:hypothetical protein